MRRVLVLPTVFALLLALPGVAGAARPDRFSDDRWSLSCAGLETGAGGEIFLALEISEAFGSFGALAIWAPDADPFEEPPVAVSGDSESSVDGSQLTASFELWAFDPGADPPLGDRLGIAELLATLTPIGDPEPFDIDVKEGNRLIRASGTRQLFSVDGELVLPDGDMVDLSGCVVEHVVEAFFGTNPAGVPASFISRTEGIQLNCSWEVDEGFVSLFAVSDAFGTFSDLFIETDAGFVSGGSDDVTLTRTQYAAMFELFSEEGEPSGSATASATLTPTGERFRIVERFSEGSFKLRGERLSVDGGVTISLGAELIELQLDDESCMAVDGIATSHFVDPRGPKGRPLANDTPEGALALRIGQSDRVITGGNAQEPEAPCVQEDEMGEPLELPIEFTAWWSFTGTGDEVTISTTESDFDTIVAVYEVVDGGLVQVACVDDVFEPDFSLQAVVTITTEAGATYLIQAGGYAGSTGRLVVSLE